MEKDSLNNINNYTNLPEGIQKGLEYLKNTDFSKIEDGRYLIFGEDIYVNIQSYLTKSDADYEAHRKYIDIQYMISGRENIGVTDYSTCKTTIEYNEDKDIEFLRGNGSFFELKTGEFMILYPKDAHKPSLSLDSANPENVRKAVVKVRI